jgi:hypothetical protein
MLKCWSINDLSSFFYLLCNCVPVGYDKLMFYEQYVTQHVPNVHIVCYVYCRCSEGAEC